ncbi:hypothetical protein M758_2G197900 [Ceratodon purpureus]|nr:hypothetical protein M758_2G197900 [Ceratodon purpureus]
MARVWDDLPPEVVENVLARLPVHALCRSRLVCKKWDHLITDPGFASFYAQTSRRASHVLLMPRELSICRSIKRKRNWEILDIEEKRFYTLSENFIEDYLLRTNKDFAHFIPCMKFTLAADAGLVYAMYFKYETRRHIVCNPVSKDIHQIPEPKFHILYNRDIFLMLVDNATQSYRIVTIQLYDSHYSRRDQVHLYDSKTLQWRKLCKIPGDSYLAHSSIFLRGVLFTLFFDLSITPWRPKLFSCDLDTGVWCYIDVQLPQPSHPQDKLQLVVSLDRLFCVEFSGLRRCRSSHMTDWEALIDLEPEQAKRPVTVVIWEILLDDREVRKVAEMPKHSLQTLKGDPVVPLGCGDSIVVSSLVAGCCVAFDLLKRCWHDPSTITEHMYGTCMLDLYREYAGLVNLDLRKFGTV